jgi:pyridoxal phosphate enzyme (YggS family)
VTDVGERLAAVRERIAVAARAAGRAPDDVGLVAISKGVPAARVVLAAQAGQRRFGENRVQEATTKLPAVEAALDAPLEWHLVGRLQRNKARAAVRLFDVIHSVDSPELARALARGAQELGRRPRVLVQVNVDAEPQKGGVAADAVAPLVAAIDELPALELVGLMAIPRPAADAEALRPAFARLRELRDSLDAGRPEGRRLRELSMGMSADFEVAIGEGATLVRVGTAIFGERS